jgi:hypothetical protein
MGRGAVSGPGTGEVGYALKFISGKYQGGEFPLKPNKQVVIGRSSELDMVLVEDMVSRKHAKIAVQGGKISIEDLGSTNGTFVNGEKVRTARLKEGDRILIGTSILKLVVAGAESSQLSDAAVKHNLEAVAQAQAAKTKTSSMSGKIEDIPLPDLLQLFHTSKKNGVLVVKGGHEGRIYLRQGRVYYAVIDGRHELGPQKSFNRIITWEDGDFELRAAESEEFMVELDQSTEALLMDALRMMDEYKRIARDLPAPEASLELCRPLSKPLRELTPRELDVLQLVYNHASLQEMCDHSLIDDVEIAQAVLDLLRKDYIRGS